MKKNNRFLVNLNLDNDNIRVRVGARIRELRTDKGLSLRQLSELAGINHSNICAIENGKYNARLDTLAKLEAVFDCRLDFVAKK